MVNSASDVLVCLKEREARLAGAGIFRILIFANFFNFFPELRHLMGEADSEELSDFLRINGIDTSSAGGSSASHNHLRFVDTRQTKPTFVQFVLDAFPVSPTLTN